MTNQNEVKETAMAMVNKNDLIMPSLVENLTHSQHSFYSSIVDNGTRKSKITIYNAINKADEKLDNHKGEVLKIRDVVAHTVSLVDENTGEILDCLRIVLVDEKGVGYESISQGIYSSLQKIFAVVGLPTWDEPLQIKCVEQRTRKGFKTLTLELV